MKKIFSLLFAIVISFSVFAQDYTITAPPKDKGYDSFYKKYVNVNGIPIMCSNKVPDEAVYAACKTVDFMTKGLPKRVLDAMVEHKARLSIMARYEGTTDIPEHAYLADDTTLNWDLRARGLGGDVNDPLTSCAEENLLCYQIDKYHAEDIFVHEFAHAIHLIGIVSVDEGINDLLQESLDAALAEGKYQNVYAATDFKEYWAEGVQDWFNVNAEVPETDGKHNWVNTREDLKKYDKRLYDIISKYFSDSDESPSCHAVQNLYTE